MRIPIPVLLALACLACAGARASTGTVHTPQVDLGFETFGMRGHALPVIVVNGGPGLSHVYMLQNDMWRRVARHRLVVFYDQRGTGASKRLQPNAPQTMDAQVQDLDAVRAALRLDKVAIVGDSFGGMIAMAYAAAHPDHMAKLVLSDSAAPSWATMVHLLPDVFPDIEQQDDDRQNQLGPTTDAAARASLLDHFRMIFYAPAKRDTYIAHMGDLGFEPAVADALSKATANLDLTSSLPGFRFPTLVISGRYDMNVAPLTAWRMAHEIRGARLVFFEQSGHLPSYEEPDRYQSVLEQFLNQT